jgi:hypothetical protein
MACALDQAVEWTWICWKFSRNNVKITNSRN